MPCVLQQHKCSSDHVQLLLMNPAHERMIWGLTFAQSVFQNSLSGAKLWSMLSQGSSVPWPDALKSVTGRTDISASPMKEYFQKLSDWLREENQKHADNCYGWGQMWPESYNLSQPRCKGGHPVYTRYM